MEVHASLYRSLFYMGIDGFKVTPVNFGEIILFYLKRFQWHGTLKSTIFGLHCTITTVRVQ